MIALWGRAARTLLAGCAPCQSFSTYSRKGRRERTDTKWGLVAEFGRLIRESQPDFVTMENVPQLMDHAVFAEFLRAMKGYQTWHGVIDCAQYGVPQTRKRLLLLASKLGRVSLISPTLINEHRGPTVREAISCLKPLEAGEADPDDKLHKACRLSEINMRRIRASRPGGTWRDWDPSLVAACHRQSTWETYPSVYGRMEWDAPAPTITTQCFGYGNGRFGHPQQDRAITLREAAILQTFPPTYQFVADGSPVRFSVLGRLIGNAVPVKLGEAVATALRMHLKSHEKRRAMNLRPQSDSSRVQDPLTAFEKSRDLTRLILTTPKTTAAKDEPKKGKKNRK